MINLDNSNDPFYRYKMPNVIVKNMKNKTHILNMNEICSSIGRDDSQVIKYMKKRLATSILISEKHEIKINGNYTTQQIQSIIMEFVEKNVLCKICGNPETKIEDEKIICEACGSILEITIR